ncbi:DUF2690 domain-containing protein [Micromonospora sp. D93]|uniref:DUF2690 domain-containing protein n=1 Tax=Micromonospora sp. D93 TaxID=2824886 RepID=UPI001B3916E9|nr:DUF2690 domain-containing protein [Micromonospora sp. D93]MBQ1019599.1 DUF2690 domain-containing protein [Micromonospora sp. D93]
MAVPTAGSAATVGCGSPCDGKDSQTYSALVGGVRGSCAQDARTVKTASNVELRYSPFCRTAWARQTDSFGYMSGVLVFSWYSDGRQRSWQDDLGTAGSWSKMVNDKGLTASACFYQYESELDQVNDIKTVQWCTARY